MAKNYRVNERRNCIGSLLQILIKKVMKIELSAVDKEQFVIIPHRLNNETVFLINPKEFICKWTKDNLHLRSSVYNQEGYLISAGFPKFFNIGERNDLSPLPDNLKDSTITMKMDGSLLVVSKYAGQYILRTRGTIDASKLETGAELDIFKKKYLQILDDSCKNEETWNTSFLFEWLTASKDHEIVLKYDNVPDWVLVGAINHENYSLYPQDVLDSFAMLNGFLRPESFKFNTINELIATVTNWKNKEGVVLYTNNGQTLHKIKSDWYKKCHSFKSSATLNKTLELFLEFNRPTLNEFQDKINNLYDWECMEMIKEYTFDIYDAYKQVKIILDDINNFIKNEVLFLTNRKDQAFKIQSAYGNTGRTGIIFKLLDNKTLDNLDYKKLMLQILKK